MIIDLNLAIDQVIREAAELAGKANYVSYSVSFEILSSLLQEILSSLFEWDYPSCTHLISKPKLRNNLMASSLR